MENTKLEQILTTALREVFEGDLIPKNPYPKLIRSLNLANIQKEVTNTFSKVVRYMVKNVTSEEGEYGITSVKSRLIFFGLKILLEWVDVDRLAALRKALLDFLPDYRNEVKNSKVN